MSEVRLHVQGLDAFFADARHMARRIDGGDVAPEPEQIAFESMELLLKVLTPNRWMLLKKLQLAGVSSIRALAQSLGRDYRGVHADVMALLDVGLVARREDTKVFVPWTRITAEMSLDAAA